MKSEAEVLLLVALFFALVMLVTVAMSQGSIMRYKMRLVVDKMSTLGGLTIILAVFMSMLMPTLPVLAADFDPQWYLTDEYLGTVSEAGDTWEMYEMVRPGSPPPVGGDVGIAAGESCVWRADQPTPAPAPFEPGDWTIKIMLNQETMPAEDDFRIYVGYIEDGEFTATADSSIYKRTGKDGKIWWFEVDISVPEGLTVPAGGYLACKIENTSSEDILVRTGESRGWIKPPDDPRYPVPELPTAILLGIGLLGLVGYLGWRRRKVSSQAYRNT